MKKAVQELGLAARRVRDCDMRGQTMAKPTIIAAKTAKPLR